MSWKCRCELCRRAFLGKIETRRCLDFPRHSHGAVLEFKRDEEEPRCVYLAELDGEILVTTRRMDGYKTLRETWCEEVRLNEYLGGCRV